MRSTWRDFLGAGICITVLLALALGLAWLGSAWTSRWLGAYHVLADVAVALVTFGLMAALLVRLLLRIWPLPAGEYGLDSAEFARWKLLTVVYRLGQGSLRWCIPFYMRQILDVLFGAQVGRDVAFGGTIDDPYRVQVGDEVILGNASLVSGNYLSGGKLVCGPIIIGHHATIGANAIVLPNTVIGEGAVVTSGSCVMPGTTIGAGETWRGNPARKWL